MSRTIYRTNKVPRELNQGGTATTETLFTTDGTTAVDLVLPQNIIGPSTTVGRQFLHVRVLASGRVTGGTTTNYTPKLYWGRSNTIGSNTSIGTGATVAVNSNSGLWTIDAELYIVVTGTALARVDGHFRNMIAGSTRTFTASAVTTASITSQDDTSTTLLGLTVTGTFSSGNAGNLAYLDEFLMEVYE